MKFRHITMTPELAMEILEHNNHNRTIRQSRVERYARQMQKGLWRDNGETIIIANDGTLLDGQHRLWAVVMSDVSVEMSIVEGVDPETFSSIDTGAGRDGGDVVHIAGFKYSKEVAGAVQHIYRYCTHKMKNKKAGLCHEEVLRLAQENQELVHSAEKVKTVRLMGSAIATALHYMFSQVDGEKADQFFTAMKTGEFFPGMGAIRAFRERIVKARMTSTFRGLRRDRLNQVEEMAMAIKAWNAFVAGKNLRIIRMGLNEEFPSIGGLPAAFIRGFEA